MIAIDKHVITEAFQALSSLQFKRQRKLKEYYNEYAKWEKINKKQVQDFDGFWTDYTLWYNPEDERYVCIFGDDDLYTPDNADPDFECETEEEALEWFDSYNGFSDDDWVDESLNESSYSIHSQQDLDDARADLSKKFNDFRASRLPKSDYRYKQLLKDEKDLEKKANEFTASQKGQEIVTKAKLSKLITKLTGLVPIKTTTTSIRGYRPIVGGSFELERYTYDNDITVRFYNNYQVIPELMSKLNDLGYNVRYYSDNAKDTLQVSIFKDNFTTPDWFDETDVDFDESLKEDTVKQGKHWVNKGDSGETHGKFNTKKEADAQRKAMFANGYKG